MLSRFFQTSFSSLHLITYIFPVIPLFAPIPLNITLIGPLLLFLDPSPHPLSPLIYVTSTSFPLLFYLPTLCNPLKDSSLVPFITLLFNDPFECSLPPRILFLTSLLPDIPLIALLPVNPTNNYHPAIIPWITPLLPLIPFNFSPPEM